MPYSINSDKLKPWNNLPNVPPDRETYQDVDIIKLRNAKATLGRSKGRSITIPNQFLLINSISLQEAKDQRQQYVENTAEIILSNYLRRTSLKKG